MFIDSHCHIQHSVSPEELKPALLKASQSLLFAVEISTTESEILNWNEIQLPGNLLKAYGLSPDHTPVFNPELSKRTRNVLDLCKVQALGEIGMDYHWDYGNTARQEALFRDQIEAALERNLPIIIHTRDAYEDTLRILKSYQYKKAVIMHCFSYGPEEAENFLSEGYYLSFAGNITYNSAKTIQEAAKICPDERLLMETDAPYLAPVPLRGQKNKPEYIEYTYRYTSALRNTTLPDMEKTIEANFRRIFNL